MQQTQNKLETVSIAELLQNRQHARKTPNAVNTRREEERVEEKEEGKKQLVRKLWVEDEGMEEG